MTQQEFFEHVLRELERLQIPYMVAGSIGAMLYSQPRLTNDMDVVIDSSADRVPELEAAFPLPTFYITPAHAMREEIGRRGMFNIIHLGTASKVDLIVRKNTPHAREEFRRRRPEPFTAGFDCPTATPEDIILVKLRYFREGSSVKHLRDIRSILDIRADALDHDYLERWVRALELAGEWSQAQGFRGE